MSSSSSGNCCNSRFDCTRPSCLCFGAEVYCAEDCMCHCTNKCFNRSTHGSVVEKLREEFKSRDPFAFLREDDVRERQEETPDDVALPSPERQEENHEVTAKCNCGESQCMKKQYCACLKEGVECSLLCTCSVECKNWIRIMCFCKSGCDTTVCHCYQWKLGCGKGCKYCEEKCQNPFGKKRDVKEIDEVRVLTLSICWSWKKETNQASRRCRVLLLARI